MINKFFSLNVSYRSILLIRTSEVSTVPTKSIQHPYIRPLKVPTKWLFFATLFLPLLIINVITRYVIRDGSPFQAKQQLIKFGFGFLINLTVCEIFKKAFGRLRPHTYTFCQLSQLCPSGSVDQWVESFECKNPDSNWVYLINTRLSFYSGHSSLGSFAGTYLVCFLHETFSLLKKALVILFDLFIFTLYLYPGFTQWQIYWHFGTDILTGFTFGIIYALLIFHTVNQSSSRHSTDRPQ
ncbi:Catalytic activity protein, partial [Tyrophagus putrescentiae]